MVTLVHSIITLHYFTSTVNALPHSLSSVQWD